MGLLDQYKIKGQRHTKLQEKNIESREQIPRGVSSDIQTSDSEELKVPKDEQPKEGWTDSMSREVMSA